MRLINADELKKAISNDPHIDFTDDDIFKLIDNAPTVEPEKAKESEIIKAYTKGFDTGVETAKNERPQGEWICKTKSTFPQYQPDEYLCSRCNFLVNHITKFCPNCGADMKGGAE